MTGHPDDQTYANWRGPLLSAFSTYNLKNTTPVNVAGYVTNFQSLLLSVSIAGAAGYQITASWFTDATQNILVATNTWTVSASQQIQMLTPILGNYVTLALTTTSVPGFNINVGFAPTNIAVPSTKYVNSGNINFITSFNVPANTSSIFPLQYVSEGRMHWYASDLAGSGKIQLRISMLTAAGTEAATIDQVNTLTTQANGDVTLPAQGVGIVFQNTDVVVHAVKFFIAADGR